MLNSVASFCDKYGLLAPGDSIVIGVSGGPDSLCLLDVLHKLAPRLNLSLTVAHLNHHLRGPHADADAAFVRTMAHTRQIPVVTETKNVAHLARQRQQSIEETARQARYGFLWRVANATGSGKIAVGHNTDDHVETILMHFLRGSGILGLRGILPVVNIAGLRLPADDGPNDDASHSPQLIRPLLQTSRAAIEAYCRQNNLSPRQDHTNLDTTYFRNRLRHELIPYLETFNPNLRQTLQRTAHVISAETEVLSHQLNQIWSKVVLAESPAGVTFALEPWRQMPLALKRSTLRRAIETLRRGLRDIGFDHIENAIELLETGKTGTQGTLPQGLQLRVGYNNFTIAPAAWSAGAPSAEFPQVQQPVPVNLPGQTQLPHSSWQLEAQLYPANAVSPEQIRRASRWEAYLDAAVAGPPAVLRPRQPGDYFYPLGMAGQRKKINEFMINEKIPAGRRAAVPLLVANGQVLWVCGYRPDDRARIGPSTRQIFHLRFLAGQVKKIHV